MILATRREVLKISGGAALAGTLVGVCEPSKGAASDDEKPVGLVIDTHIHAVSPQLPGIKSQPEDLLKLYEGPLQGMVHRLEEEMTAGKVDFAFAMGSLGGTIADPLGISRTLQLCDMVPRLRAVGVADPRQTEPGFLKAVEAQIDNNRNKIVAFKAYLGYLHFGPDVPPSVRLRASLAILDAANALKAEEAGPTSAESVQAKMDHQRFIDSLG
jgi:hypothetical protein